MRAAGNGPAQPRGVVPAQRAASVSRFYQSVDLGCLGGRATAAASGGRVKQGAAHAVKAFIIEHGERSDRGPAPGLGGSGSLCYQGHGLLPDLQADFPYRYRWRLAAFWSTAPRPCARLLPGPWHVILPFSSLRSAKVGAAPDQ